MNVNMNMHEASSRMEGRVVALRKGAWTSEEDIHLRICVQTYGEGNWHLVPRRANLNRCRKSCRLRWLNYLRPDIKRGKFATDEVDLMVRLQRLLGNRWSLIARRLPGRTANDVKNYWNSHMLKKRAPPTHRMVNNIYPSDQHVFSPGILVKPRPRTFKNINTGLTCSDLKTTSLLHPDPPSTDNLAGNIPLPSPLPAENNDDLWWENILMFGEDDPQYCCYPNTNWSTEEVSSSLHQEASACESNISEAMRYLNP